MWAAGGAERELTGPKSANSLISGRKHIYKNGLNSGICENHLIVKYLIYSQATAKNGRGVGRGVECRSRRPRSGGQVHPEKQICRTDQCRIRSNSLISGRKHIYKTGLNSGICENHLIVKYISHYSRSQPQAGNDNWEAPPPHPLPWIRQNKSGLYKSLFYSRSQPQAGNDNWEAPPPHPLPWIRPNKSGLYKKAPPLDQTRFGVLQEGFPCRVPY